MYSLYDVGALQDVRLEIAANLDKFEPADLGACGEPYAADSVCAITNAIATHSYLGVGIIPPTPSWGNMISDSQSFYQVAWWFLVFPGLALVLTTLAFNLLGDSVRDALDPRTDIRVR